MNPDTDISSADLRFFVTVAVASSLAAAARELDVSRSAVTQRLRQLEERLGCELIERSTRHLRLTESGHIVLARGKMVLDELDSIAEDLSLRRKVVGGHLRIAAPLGFGRRYITPLLADFRTAHPSVRVSLTLSERPLVYEEGNWDLIIHIGELKNSSLVMVRLAPNERYLCASPAYLAVHGEPREPLDLARHSCLALRQNDEDVTLWRFIDEQQNCTPVRITPTMSSNDGEAVRTWALQGLGLMVRSEWDVDEDLRLGRLQRVLPNLCMPSADVVALLGKRGGRSARANVFLASLQERLKPVPWRRGVKPDQNTE